MTRRPRAPGRGAAVGRRDPVAAAAAAVGHRPGGAAAAARHRGASRAARRRREPAGPPADPPDLRVHASPSPPTTSSTPGSARCSIGLQWLLSRSGPLAVGINQGGCFMRALHDERAGGGGHARHPVPRRHAVGRHGRRQGAPVLGLHDVGVPVAARVARPHPHPQRRPASRRRRCSPTTCPPNSTAAPRWRR